MLALALFYTVYVFILAPSAWEILTSDERGLLFDDVAKMQSNYIEETHEFFGLLICLSVLGINYLAYKSK